MLLEIVQDVTKDVKPIYSAVVDRMDLGVEWNKGA